MLDFLQEIEYNRRYKLKMKGQNMFKKLIPTVAMIAMVGATPALANKTYVGNNGYYATVENVVNNTKTIQTPQQVCTQQMVTERVDNQDLIGGVDGIIGGIAGGVIGNQIGKGNGNQIATVLGAIIGNRAMAKPGQPQYRQVEKMVCNTVYETKTQTVDYTVTLRYNGVVWNTVMISAPPIGSQIKVTGISVGE